MAERVTTAALYEIVKSIKEDTTEIKLNDIEQWEQININRENIASQKSIIRIIEVFLTGIILSIGSLIWGKYK